MSSRRSFVAIDDDDSAEDYGVAKRPKPASQVNIEEESLKLSDFEDDDDDDDDEDDEDGQMPVVSSYSGDISELEFAKSAKQQGALNLKTFKQRVAELKKSTLARSLSELLDSKQLVDDNIITKWMEYLRENKCGYDRRLFFMPTFFFPIIEKNDHSQFADVTRDILEEDKLFRNNKKKIETLLFVPVCLDSHWMVCVVDLMRRTMAIYDSLTNGHQRLMADKDISEHGFICQKIGHWLQYRYAKEKLAAVAPTFTEKPPIEYVPRQHRSVDCGIFMCMYMSYLCSRIKFDFKQKDMNLLRRWIFKCINLR